MKTSIVSLTTAALCGCATVTPYTGPKSSDSSQVQFQVTGLIKHAALPDDMLVVHLLDGTTKLGTLKFTETNARDAIRIDRNRPITLRFASIQPHFGGHTSCNRDVPFVAEESTEYTVTYATTKNACTIRISKLTSTGSLTLLGEFPGVASGVQYKATTIY